jgi:hypothetical protein
MVVITYGEIMKQHLITNKKQDRIGTWYGQNISELDKEELLKVIKFLSNENKKMREENGEIFTSKMA